MFIASSNSSSAALLAAGEYSTQSSPLALLPSSTAIQYQAHDFVNLATLGALLWDIILTIPCDFKLLTNYTISLPTIAYFLSRIFTTTYFVLVILFDSIEISACNTMLLCTDLCSAAAISLTACLFFLRARAVFRRSLLLVVFFTFIWVSNSVIQHVIIPSVQRAEHIGDTKFCIETATKPWGSAAVFVNSFFDTAVFVAISFKLVSTARNVRSGDNTRGSLCIQTFVKGFGLPEFSKALLQSGQQYYLVAVISSILTAITLLLPTSPVLRVIITGPNIALGNAMACRVFRKIKFGVINAELLSEPKSSIHFAENGMMRARKSSISTLTIDSKQSTSISDDKSSLDDEKYFENCNTLAQLEATTARQDDAERAISCIEEIHRLVPPIYST